MMEYMREVTARGERIIYMVDLMDIVSENARRLHMTRVVERLKEQVDATARVPDWLRFARARQGSE